MAKRKQTTWIDVGKGRRVAEEPVMPGVRAAEGGGWWVRARWSDPRTGKRREVSRFLDVPSAKEAYRWLQEAIEGRKQATPGQGTKQTQFKEYAASLFEEKVKRGDIQSAAGRRKWADILEHYLFPAFGDVFMSQLTIRDIRQWRDACAVSARRGDVAPTTVNTWLGVLRVILKAGANDEACMFGLAESIQLLSLRGHRTYTPEEPNALRAADVPRFLSMMRERYPQHYAMTALGFCTGLRPSSLRPIRRDIDVLWNENLLVIRRSQTIGDEVMESTKSGADVLIALPPALVEILHWHLDNLRTRKMRESELLFPARTGGFRARDVLTKPFVYVSKAIGLDYKVSSRAMRRTFQDLARAAEVADVVTRSISGHATERMQQHYSTVFADEQRANLQNLMQMALGQNTSQYEMHPEMHPESVLDGPHRPETVHPDPGTSI